jgi:hypothetical protein
MQIAKLSEGSTVEGSRNFVTFSYVIQCDTFVWFLTFLLICKWTTYCPICTDGPHIVKFVLMVHILSNLYWWATYCPVCTYGPHIVQFVLMGHVLSYLYWWATYYPVSTDGPHIVQFVLMGHILSNYPTLVKEKKKFNCRTTKCTLK